ncbi:MAG: hypothetical protein HUU22_15940, partial [Phycisphaerae bacterium]|nr:hypothetical protein [Phycisphaerae bacterium]
LNDATGNCVGVVCAGGGSVGGSCSSANLYAVRFTRMDAWGNLISPVYLDGLPPALPVDDIDCTASTAEGCEPADGMPQEEVLAGPYQYHGGDRYETDLIDMDKLLRPDGGQPDPGAGRSTGFVHVGVRYYEPATGRFLQHDPMFIDPTPFAWGQHNRWVYCANDPVNAFDATGRWITLVVRLVAVLLLVLGVYEAGDWYATASKHPHLRQTQIDTLGQYNPCDSTGDLRTSIQNIAKSMPGTSLTGPPPSPSADDATIWDLIGTVIDFLLGLLAE